jgi:hypothetical protein
VARFERLKRFAADAFDLVAGRIDVGQQHDCRVVERGRFRKEIARPG